MNCQTALEMIHPYIDRELDELQTAEVELHLQHCQECSISCREQIALRSALQDGSFFYRAPAEFKRHIASSLQKEVKAEANHTATSSGVISLR